MGVDRLCPLAGLICLPFHKRDSLTSRQLHVNFSSTWPRLVPARSHSIPDVSSSAPVTCLFILHSDLMPPVKAPTGPTILTSPAGIQTRPCLILCSSSKSPRTLGPVPHRRFTTKQRSARQWVRARCGENGLQVVFSYHRDEYL